MRTLVLLVSLCACNKDSVPTPEVSDTDTDAEIVVSCEESDPVYVEFEDVLQNPEPEYLEFEGWGVFHSIPENPRGVMFGFHGSNSALAQTVGVEWTLLYNELQARGIGWISSESQERTNAHWDLSSSTENNVDFAFHARLRDELIATTDLVEETPVFAMGFSGGGGFTPTFLSLAEESGWDARAGLVHNSAGRDEGFPIFYVANDNDFTARASSVQSSYDSAIASGIDARYLLIEEHDLDREELNKIEDFDLEYSVGLWDELVEMGMIDDNGTRLVELGGSEIAVFNQYEIQSEGRAPAKVVAQLKVVWAMHRVSAASAHDEICFLDSHLAD